jgi:hypothetical protein
VLSTTHQVDVDAAPANDPVGDYSAWSDDVRQNGRPVGTDAAVCTTTHVGMQGADLSALCTVILSLPDGQIDLQGLVTQMPNGPDIPATFAVAAGTGKYRTARGDAVATYLPKPRHQSHHRPRRGPGQLIRTSWHESGSAVPPSGLVRPI